MIFWTGGIGKHLKRRVDPFSPEGGSIELNLGKIVEVYKLKENFWVEYTDKLMTSRYCHSSLIWGSYIYIFLGYDVEDTCLNSVGVERFKIDTSEATLYQDTNWSVK